MASGVVVISLRRPTGDNRKEIALSVLNLIIAVAAAVISPVPVGASYGATARRRRYTSL